MVWILQALPQTFFQTIIKENCFQLAYIDFKYQTRPTAMLSHYFLTSQDIQWWVTYNFCYSMSEEESSPSSKFQITICDVNEPTITEDDFISFMCFVSRNCSDFTTFRLVIWALAYWRGPESISWSRALENRAANEFRSRNSVSVCFMAHSGPGESVTCDVQC